jgi:hypothetical protein
MIQIDGGKTAFLPGEIIRGSVALEADRHPHTVELRLFWYTTGRAPSDVAIIEAQTLQPTSQPIPFTFTLPPGPYSFVGSLITLNWAIELVFKPSSHADRAEFSMSPDGKPLALTAVGSTSQGLLRA